VERTLLSAAFYLDLDFCLSTHGPVQSRGRAALQRRVKRTNHEAASAADAPSTARCHPERSMRIRFMNPHAQSKDPCTHALAPAVSGSSPGIAGVIGGNPKRGAAVESHPSKNEGWGTRLYPGDTGRTP
jgi:hypothetical protein